jgi:hypothetical protein
VGIGLFVGGLVVGVWMRTTLLEQDVGAVLRSGPMILAGGIILPLFALVMGVTALVHRRRLRRLRALQKALADS